MILSVGIVAYNEEKYLPALLSDMVAQEYPHDQIELLLIDSNSTDNTEKIMQQFKESRSDFFAVKVLHNAKKIQAAGWNVAILNYTGDVLVRIDAHTKIPSDFTRKVMACIETGENVVGGVRPCIIEHETPWTNVLLQVENSLFGSSINTSRRSSQKQYVKTMFHAAYRRCVLDDVGLFNEKLLRTEDNEFHYRIREKGYQLYFDPDIVSYQYARNSFLRMIKQKYGNGFWIGLTAKICPKCLSLYHFIPLLFVCGIVFTTIFAAFGITWMAILLWSLYLFFCLVNTVISGINNGFFFQSILMPVIFLTLHVSYGIGTLMGLMHTKKEVQ